MLGVWWVGVVFLGWLKIGKMYWIAGYIYCCDQLYVDWGAARGGQSIEGQARTDRSWFRRVVLSAPSYKTSAKELEQFLEEESGKKEEEIKQLKEDFIIKEKLQKQTKQELTMLQNDYAELKVLPSRLSPKWLPQPRGQKLLRKPKKTSNECRTSSCPCKAKTANSTTSSSSKTVR